MRKKIRFYLFNYYGLAFILVIALVSVILPFLFSNNLEGFDSAGHLASAYYIKNFFWPWPDGWNIALISGFPQGLFYASGFHWLVAALSFVVPLEMAAKILISLSIFLFPIGVFLLAKKIFRQPLISSAVTFFVCIFYFFEVGLNDNMFSDLFFGMLNHLASLTLFVFYIWALVHFIARTKKWTTPLLLLVATFLFHLMTGVVALLLTLLIFIFNGGGDHGKILKKGLVKILGYALFLLLFWLVPLILNINYTSGSDASSFYSPLIIILTPVIILINFLAFIKKGEFQPLIKAMALTGIIISLMAMLGGAISLDGFPLHFTRFLIYPLILTPILLLYLVKSYSINWQLVNVVGVLSFFFYFTFLRIIPIGPFASDLLPGINNYYESGRVMALGHSNNLDARFHSTRMKLATQYNLPVAEGLFVESSPNGWFVMSLLRSWDGVDNNFTWAYRHLSDVADLSWGARLFGINYEYRISDLSPSENEKNLKNAFENLVEERENLITRELTKNERDLFFKVFKERLLDDENIINIVGTNKTGFYYQSLYKVHDTDLAEAVYLPPVNIEKDWSNMTKKWWSSDWLKSSASDYLYDKPLLVYQAPVADWQISSEKIDFTVQNIGTKMDSFIVDASALSSPAPIYVKVGYFPFWQAYDESGQRLEVYKASPNFMLVYGWGQITFKYIKPFYYYVGYIISGLTLLLLILSYLYQKRRKLLKKE